MQGITYVENFICAPDNLFRWLLTNADWDNTMAARKTASFGVAYNYSQMHYPFKDMPTPISEMITRLQDTLGFTPNNCLINYYPDGKSKMGFHSDQTDMLAPDTGIAIVSLGETRTLRFRNIGNKDVVKDFLLPPGSLIYMTAELQQYWQHAIPASNTNRGRMSLTFRHIVA